MINVQVGIRLQALRHKIDEALERCSLLLSGGCPITYVRPGTVRLAVKVTE
jgi:hypothetical protein